MSRQNIVVVLISVVLSAGLSSIACLFICKTRETRSSDVLRVKTLEIVDSEGRVRGAFGLVPLPDGHMLPRLTMNDPKGDSVIRMGVDQRGDGDLSFSNDYWQEGAVVLGHITTVDDGSQSKARSVKDYTGAWGLQVRAPNGKYIGMGVANSGKPFAPSEATIHVQK